MGFTYKIPSNLNLQIGHTVLVPFGKQKITGYIVASSQKPNSQDLDLSIAFSIPFLHLSPILPLHRDIQLLSGWLGRLYPQRSPKTTRSNPFRYWFPQKRTDALADQEIIVPAQSMLMRDIIARSGRTEKSLFNTSTKNSNQKLFVKASHDQLWLGSNRRKRKRWRKAKVKTVTLFHKSLLRHFMALECKRRSISSTKRMAPWMFVIWKL